jgi:hypothetical protein
MAKAVYIEGPEAHKRFESGLKAILSAKKPKSSKKAAKVAETSRQG